MTNDVTKFFGSQKLPDKEKLSQALSGYSAAANALVGGKALLRLMKNGEWVMGQNNEKVREGTRLIANPASLSTGYVAWFQGKPEREVMQPIQKWQDNPIDFNSLPEVNSGTVPPGSKDGKPSGRGWEPQSSIDFMTQAKIPVAVQYKTTSKGGMQALAALAGEIFCAIEANPHYAYPVLELTTSGYQHPNREYGYIYTPAFVIVGWLDENGEPAKEFEKLTTGKDSML